MARPYENLPPRGSFARAAYDHLGWPVRTTILRASSPEFAAAYDRVAADPTTIKRLAAPLACEVVRALCHEDTPTARRIHTVVCSTDKRTTVLKAASFWRPFDPDDDAFEPGATLPRYNDAGMWIMAEQVDSFTPEDVAHWLTGAPADLRKEVADQICSLADDDETFAKWASWLVVNHASGALPADTLNEAIAADRIPWGKLTLSWDLMSDRLLRLGTPADVVDYTNRSFGSVCFHAEVAELVDAIVDGRSRLVLADAEEWLRALDGYGGADVQPVLAETILHRLPGMIAALSGWDRRYSAVRPLYEILEQEFGTDVARWELAIGIADAWTGSVDGLIDAVRTVIAAA